MIRARTVRTLLPVVVASFCMIFASCNVLGDLSPDTRPGNIHVIVKLSSTDPTDDTRVSGVEIQVERYALCIFCDDRFRSPAETRNAVSNGAGEVAFRDLPAGECDVVAVSSAGWAPVGTKERVDVVAGGTTEIVVLVNSVP